MPHRSAIATSELARLLGALAHRHRIQIIEELRRGEQDVTSLTNTLAISTSRVSQHLRVLKAHHLLQERRDGRHVFYSLVEPDVATWLAQGLSFVEAELIDPHAIHEAIEHARLSWLED